MTCIIHSFLCNTNSMRRPLTVFNIGKVTVKMVEKPLDDLDTLVLVSVFQQFNTWLLYIPSGLEKT